MSKIKISLLCPTRQRPNQLKRLYKSAMETADRPKEVELVAFIDEDDNSYNEIEYPRLIKVRKPYVILAECWNDCYRVCRGDYLQLTGDDIVFRTPSWDTMVKERIDACPAKIGFVYGNDGTSFGNGFGTHGFIHRNWAQACGYFVPPYFSAGYVDVWLNDLGKRLSQHHYIEMLTEHMHTGFGKAELDDVYRLGMERTERDDPEQIYKDKEPDRVIDLEKLERFRSEYVG
jgi:glycosyl transferase/beta-hydroxylase protein BlmF